MKSVTRPLYLLIIIFVLLGFITSLCCAQERREKFNFGVIVPLSGEWSFLGEGIRNSALLAKEEFAQKNLPIDILIEDNSGSQKDSALIAQRLIGQNNAKILVSIFSGVAQTLKPIAEKNKVIHIGICSDQNAAGGKYSFINYITARQGAEKFVEHLATNTDQKEFAVFAQNEAGFLKISEELEKLAPSKNLKISFTETFNAGTRDFRSLIARNYHSLPGLIVLLSLSPDMEILAKQLREAGYQGHFTSIEAFSLTTDTNPFKGEWYIDAPTDNNFYGKYLSEFKQPPPQGASQAYGTFIMMSGILSEFDYKPSTDQIAEALRRLQNGRSNPFSTEPVVKILGSRAHE